MVTLFVTFLLLPGPSSTAFSGVPLTGKAQALLCGAVVLIALTVLYRPIRRTRTIWIIVLGMAIAGKLLLSTFLVVAGWKGTYFFPRDWREQPTTLVRQSFYQSGAISPYRVDPKLDFRGGSFALHFVNDLPRARFKEEGLNQDVRRDRTLPLTIEWEAYVPGGHARDVSITADGLVTVTIDGQRMVRARDPRDVRVTFPFLEKGREHRVRVLYEKPRETIPLFRLTGLDEVAMPFARTHDPAVSRYAATGVACLGILALLTLAAAFLDAYHPISRFVLESAWEHPSRMATVAFLAVFLGAGLKYGIPMRQATVPMPYGDDFLVYESQARQILFHGPLLVDEAGVGQPYYHYPLYPYALALGHVLFGEDFGAIVLVNFFALALVGPLCWITLRRYASERALTIVLALLTWLGLVHFGRYAKTAFSDNLYVPLTFAAIAALCAAYERPSWMRFAIVGVITALAAATRPSFLLFVPFAIGAILLEKRLGSVATRIKHCLSYCGGFFAGVSPFTFRNWIVSGKFVLLVSSFVMLPFFLYAPEDVIPAFSAPDAPPPSLANSVKLASEILLDRPLAIAWLELRKIAFTLGLTSVGPEAAGSPPRYLVIFTLLFIWCVWMRRLPWALRNTLLAFALSHLTAVAIAAPWTYGYKTILPLHAAFLLSIAFVLPDRRAADRIRATPPTAGGNHRATITVVLPTYNERESIRSVIRDFFDTGVVDEVIVVNNNAVPGTSAQIEGSGAREVFEPVQGYGAACRRGLREATCDYIVLCEPDGTFVARDLFKLLAYADDFDVVYGSRTSQQFIWRGANMGLFLRVGNWAVAKYMEVLLNAPSLTDVGCTMRLIKREVAQHLDAKYRVDGSEFGVEMMVLTLLERHRVVQIPVNYKPRVGASSVTGDPGKAFFLGLRMISLITRHSLRDLRLSSRVTNSGGVADVS